MIAEFTTIAAIAWVTWRGVAVSAGYRQKVPKPESLIDSGLEIREHVAEVTTYHLNGSRVPDHQVPFLLIDLRKLRKKEGKNLEESDRYVWKLNQTIPKEEIEPYLEVLGFACRRNQGRIRRAMRRFNLPAPFLYRSWTFSLKSSAQQGEQMTPSL